MGQKRILSQVMAWLAAGALMGGGMAWDARSAQEPSGIADHDITLAIEADLLVDKRGASHLLDVTTSDAVKHGMR